MDLGPVCQAMNINRGDRMDYLSLPCRPMIFRWLNMAEDLA